MRPIKAIWRVVEGTAAALSARLIKPILHDRRPPEYAARAVGVGLFIACTPTMGLQIPLVFALWVAVRALKREWRFNPILASAWTVPSNVFTMAPIYYVFVQIGRVMLGRWEKLRPYESYRLRFERTADDSADWIDGWWAQANALIGEFGLPLLVGWLPWAIGLSALGYWWSLRLVRRHRAARARVTTRR